MSSEKLHLFPYFFGGGDGTQGFVHAGQELYH
jgi:hypothetical protein